MEKTTDELHWRETYFILFPQSQRPYLEMVSAALAKANSRYKLKNLAANDEGLIESLLVESDEDHAAVEISFEVGEGVIEQNLEWATQLQDELRPEQLQEMMSADARLDVAHFERVQAASEGQTNGASPFGDEFNDEFGDGEDENFDMLDPTCLLTVVDALSQLTDGLTFDPASGEIL